MMAAGVQTPVRIIINVLVLFFIICLTTVAGQVLTPPYFNLAQGRKITATATCGVGVANPELYCRLTGTSTTTGGGRTSALDSEELIQGQLCYYCDPSVPSNDHRPEFAIDGTERWWQSPPLSRLGVELNKVNLTVSLGQEFHVAYVFIKMANSPRPGVWVLERSTDFGKTWQPWQYFADTPSDCINFFNTSADSSLEADDQILCTTAFSKVVPLSNGEIVVSLVNGRPNANNFSYADSLQQWTKATDVKLRLLRTKTLLGHLMAIARQDPTVTRRYYYSIKDISIGGRCVCNGHAETCDTPDPSTNKLLCDCQHNTCGAQCDYCCPGFTQKRWRRALIDQPFMCEPCECYGHSDECIFDEEIERNQLSIDIYGVYEGGGVCQNCSHNTMGINCEQCIPTFYRPYDVPRNATDACRPCQCDLTVSTGECEEGSGRCLCRPEFAGVNCDRCNFGYYDYPYCIPCDCDVNGTEGQICTVGTGKCPCKINFDGAKCDQCALGYYNFPECIPCECNPTGSLRTACDLESGQCECRSNYGGRECGECAAGYYNYPVCDYCDCDHSGTEPGVCNNETGACMCRSNFDGSRCDRCFPGFYAFPVCEECQCVFPGSLTSVCGEDGQCRCKSNFGGQNCDRCAPGFYNYPSCTPCNCDFYGSLSQSCNQSTGQCECRSNFVGLMCDKCGENFYNYPMCEVCNCNPYGSKQTPGYPLGGCGIVISGLLCECKDQVMGRICDVCKPGYWNLDRNNPDGCQECDCFAPGTLTGLNQCDMITGQCTCKPDVGGRDCDRCLDGFYNLQADNLFGCVDCNCDPGGSLRMSCDKSTGQCVCKQRVSGRRCEKPLSGHFYPTLHQYKFEIEDGRTPEGARVRYDYDERIFPDFSWRGYAILTSVQPEVLLDVNIRIPSLYQLIYRFVNRQNNPVKGTVTLSPESPTDDVQTGEITFVPTQDPKFSSVTSGAIQAFVLNPGRWTISTNVPDNIFLDYFVFIPQTYYEATQVQEKVTRPCASPEDPGPCVQFGYPDLTNYPTVYGKEGYVVVDNERRDAVTLPDDGSVELGSTGLVVVNANQSSIIIDLRVPEPGHYVIVLSYLNPQNNSQNLDIEVVTADERETAFVKLSSCKLSTLCRQVLRESGGKEAVFNISSGFATLYISGQQDVDIAIEAVYAIPIGLWNSDYILPRIICIKINGICVPSTYGQPVGAVRVDFEQPPNEILIATRLPPGILDPNVGLINLNDTLRTGEEVLCPFYSPGEPSRCIKEQWTYSIPVELFATVSKPGNYIFLVHYYMPNEVGLKIPVTVYVDGKISTGEFQPQYCPNTVGCRSAIKFDESGGRTIKLTERDIRAIFNHTNGGQIWLDYLLIIPVDKYSSDFLELLPIDKSGDFLNMCVDDGFQLNLDDEFCREGAFTLTTNFNNGALDCNCLVQGSLSFTCDPFGGQCQCRENIIGRTCTACRPGYYGFPNCRECNCPYGLCEEDTGECICPPRVEGDRCERCEPESYGYDALIGCQSCNCDPDGVIGTDLNCDQITGQCNCNSNIGGRQCDTCLAGFYAFPYCQNCGCDESGTVEEICNQENAECLCKENVEGTQCDACREGMFSLNSENPKGCTQCFCFGHTTRCDSAGLFWDAISEMSGWEATNSGDEEIQEAGNTIRLSSLEDNIDDFLYWMAPQAYLGKKTLSYGGKLKFTVLFTLPRSQPSEGLIKPDIIITGGNMTIIHFHSTQPTPSTSFMMEIPLNEYEFVHEETNAPVRREQFMMVLNNIDALLIRGGYYTVVGEIRLSDVMMEIASENGQGDLADTVEMCQCPVNYQGLSCEECSPGYYRTLKAPYLGICSKCNCNGHSEECDVNTGECLNCRDNTTGSHCELCLVGFYGDPLTSGCQMCSCPLPVASNNFAAMCIVSDDGFTTSCACNEGYTGSQCESCSPGYYGNPLAVGEFCQPCACNDNIDMTDPESCDRFTGVCLSCEDHTAGLNCDMCEDWYWGDAIVRKDCQACTCDRCGSESCDQTVGACQCKPNVVGPDCNECRPNTWNFNSCIGCEECNCGVGSETQQCDLFTGVCTCMPGVEGEKCDRCQAGHWNIGPSGCAVCDCLHDGAIGCDAETGRCLCLPGVTGDLCDECLPRWVLVPTKGCQECDYCIHLLLDDLDLLEANVSVIGRSLAEVKVGLGAFNTLSRYNETVENLKPKVEDLGELDNTSFTDQLEPMRLDVEELKQNCKANHSESEKLLYRANQLPDDVKSFVKEATEAQEMTDELNKTAIETLQFIENVRMQILNTSNTHNLNFLIAEAEKITGDINARNFSGQNDSAMSEQEKADAAMDSVKPYQMKADENLNKTLNLLDDVEDRIRRLNDGINSSRYAMSDADRAINTIKRLRNWMVQDLKESLQEYDEIKMEIMKTLEAWQDKLSEAETTYEDGEVAVQDVERESSKMESALDELLNRVDFINSQIDNLKDLTNASLIHAAELSQIAAELDEMYESTRNLSENAVMAGQAYDNILNAIIEAMNSSEKALIDSQIAYNESLGIESNASFVLGFNAHLLDEALELVDTVIPSLKEKVSDADQNLLLAKEKNDLIIDELQELMKDMDKLKDSSATATTQSENTIEEAKKAEDVVMEATDLSQPIRDAMEGNQAKLNNIINNTLKANVDTREIEEFVSSVGNELPEVRDSLEKQMNKTDELADMGRLLELNVAALKEKIAQARDEANRIRVGLQYQGNTSVTLRNPPKLEDTGSFSTLSLFVKTKQPESLLVYIGNNQNTETPSTRKKRSLYQMDENDVQILSRSTRQAEFQSDYMALEMRSGFVMFTFNLGSGSARIISGRPVNDGEWHQVIAERIGKTGTLTVKSENVDDDIQQDTSKGTFAVLELDPANTLFLAGGVPTDVKIPPGLNTKYFVGSMEDVKFDGDPVGLWNFRDAENNFQGEYYRNVLQELIPKGTRFSGAGYAVLSKRTLRIRSDRTKAVLSFKTYADDGLLFYMGGKDYLSLEIREGKVVFQYDLGGGPALLESQNMYNDGNWHTVVIDRNRINGILSINNKEEVIQGQSKGTLSNLETAGDDVYFGGIDNVLVPTGNIITTGFDGCMKDISFGTLAVDVFENKRAKGITKGCIPKVTHVVTFPSTMSYISLPPVNFGSAFDLTFKFKTVENNALLVYTTDQTQSNTFSVALSEGQITIVEELGISTSQLSSRINTYDNGEWHYVSIMKMGQKLTMSIDDLEMVETQSMQGELITDTPVFFGGLPSDFTVLSDVIASVPGLKGCMGDITINKVFQNLVQVKDSKGISLTDCTIEKPVRPTVDPGLEPDQCALPQVKSDVEDPNAIQEGIRFGAEPYSRHEYAQLPIRLRVRRAVISMSFKTTAKNGVLFYTSDINHYDFLSIYMRNGLIFYSFDPGTGAAIMSSLNPYNDGQWHTVKVTRDRDKGTLEIDGIKVGSGKSSGVARSLNIKPPHFLGGLSEEAYKIAAKKLGESRTGFVGCLKDFAINKVPVNALSLAVGVKPCSSSEEGGTFIGVDGGNVQLYDKFKVGQKLEIMMDVRPRSQEGILLAVHSKKSDFLLLQMSQGEVILSADNGGGLITANYKPPNRNILCDGRWHTIKAVKDGSVLELTVDGEKAKPAVGKGKSSSADTSDSLFLGGLTDTSAKGIVANGDFVGCIRNVHINGKSEFLASGIPTGDVRLDSCPIPPPAGPNQ